MGQTASATTAQISYAATANGTIQTTGPRGGSGGTNFFNLLGSSNTSNGAGLPSFGVADFNFQSLQPTLGGTVTDISSISLLLTQANNSASTMGQISVYYTASAVDMSTLKDANQSAGPFDGSASVDSNLSPLTLLGSGEFTPVSTGTVDTISLSSFTGSPLTAFINDLNNGTTLRLVVTADNPTTVATYAAIGNMTLAGPTISFTATVVPEPSAFILAAFSLVGLLGAKNLRLRA